MQKTQWGILGTANHFALRMSNPWSKSEYGEIIAIASRTKQRAQQFARHHKIPKSYGSYQELLDDDEVEAVYIPLPNDIHKQWIIKSANAGKHILCEKPLCLNTADCEEVRDVCAEKGVLLMEAFMYRFHPQWIHTKEIISSGELGAIQAIHTNFFYNNQNPADIRNNLSMGGGGLLDIGCYAVSSSRHLLDRMPTKVCTLIQRHTKFHVDVLASVIMDFEDTQSVFTVSTCTFSAQTVSIFGQQGYIRLALPFNAPADVALSVEVTTGLGTRIISCGPCDQYLEEIDAFSRAVQGLQELPISLKDAIDNQAVLDALFESEKIAGWISLS